jgi:hypothetical protein
VTRAIGAVAAALAAGRFGTTVDSTRLRRWFAYLVFLAAAAVLAHVGAELLRQPKVNLATRATGRRARGASVSVRPYSPDRSQPRRVAARPRADGRALGRGARVAVAGGPSLPCPSPVGTPAPKPGEPWPQH